MMSPLYAGVSIFVVYFGNYIVMNLFISILLQVMSLPYRPWFIAKLPEEQAVYLRSRKYSR